MQNKENLVQYPSSRRIKRGATLQGWSLEIIIIENKSSRHRKLELVQVALQLRWEIKQRQRQSQEIALQNKEITNKISQESYRIERKSSNEERERERGKDLDTEVEARGAVRPSKVTTSKPTRWLPCLISPATTEHPQQNRRRRKKRRRNVYTVLTSVEALDLQVRVGGFKHLKNPND